MNSLENKFKILSEHHLIIEFHNGNMNLESFINFKKELFTHTDFKSGMNYFINLKNVDFEASLDDIQKFANFNNSRPTLSENRKIALVTDTPSQVASTTIYKTMLSSHNQDVEIFSTNEKALVWLNINSNSYKEVIDELKILQKDAFKL